MGLAFASLRWLRLKIEDDPGRPHLLRTVRGGATGSNQPSLRPSRPGIV
jgi:hypothetical protein